MKWSIEIVVGNNKSIDSVSIIDGILDIVSKSNDIVSLLINIFSLLGIILGLSYIYALKNKRHNATFNYWSQIKVRLYRIYSSLQSRPDLINNLYAPCIREKYEQGNPPADAVKSFLEVLNETEVFLQKTSDQMPAYRGWNEDINVVIQLINDAKLYDITLEDRMFVSSDFPKRNDYCSNVCDKIKTIIAGIDKEQSRIEKHITSKCRPLIKYSDDRNNFDSDTSTNYD